MINVFDKNLPIINKTKHSTTKGEEQKEQDERTQVLANQKKFKKGRSLRK
jgi:hypothetical protein